MKYKQLLNLLLSNHPSHPPRSRDSSGHKLIINQNNLSVSLLFYSPHHSEIGINPLSSATENLGTRSDSHPSSPMSGRDETEDWVTWPLWFSWHYKFEANCVLSGAEECPSPQVWQTQLHYTDRLQSLSWRVSLKLIMHVNRTRITSVAAEQTTSRVLIRYWS